MKGYVLIESYLTCVSTDAGRELLQLLDVGLHERHGVRRALSRHVSQTAFGRAKSGLIDRAFVPPSARCSLLELREATEGLKMKIFNFSPGFFSLMGARKKAKYNALNTKKYLSRFQGNFTVIQMGKGTWEKIRTPGNRKRTDLSVERSFGEQAN